MPVCACAWNANKVTTVLYMHLVFRLLSCLPRLTASLLMSAFRFGWNLMVLFPPPKVSLRYNVMIVLLLMSGSDWFNVYIFEIMNHLLCSKYVVTVLIDFETLLESTDTYVHYFKSTFSRLFVISRDCSKKKFVFDFNKTVCHRLDPWLMEFTLSSVHE